MLIKYPDLQNSLPLPSNIQDLLRSLPKAAQDNDPAQDQEAKRPTANCPPLQDDEPTVKMESPEHETWDQKLCLTDAERSIELTAHLYNQVHQAIDSGAELIQAISQENNFGKQVGSSSLIVRAVESGTPTAWTCCSTACRAVR